MFHKICRSIFLLFPCVESMVDADWEARQGLCGALLCDLGVAPWSDLGEGACSSLCVSGRLVDLDKLDKPRPSRFRIYLLLLGFF